MSSRIYQFWEKDHIELVQGKITSEEWKELLERLNDSSFYDELSYLANSFIKDELELIRKENNNE